MNSSVNILNWFEIPVLDMARAISFYESAFGIKMEQETMGQVEMAYFPFDMGNGKLAGALSKSNMHKPSMDGCKVYLNCNPDMAPILEQIEKAGGKIVLPKTSIGGPGFMAFFIDCEGNSIGLHSSN